MVKCIWGIASNLIYQMKLNLFHNDFTGQEKTTNNKKTL